MKKLFFTLLLSLFVLYLFAGSQAFEDRTTFQAALSTGECQNIIVNAVDKAQKTILV
jgi:hypothetical protein